MERFAAGQSLTDFLHVGRVGSSALEHLAGFFAFYFFEAIFRDFGKALIYPFYGSVFIGDNHGIVGFAGYQRELLHYGLTLFLDCNITFDSDKADRVAKLIQNRGDV